MGIENSKIILRGNIYNLEKIETNFYSGIISFQNQNGYFVFEKYKELHSQSTFQKTKELGIQELHKQGEPSASNRISHMHVTLQTFFANKMFLSIRNRYLYCTMCRQRIVKIYLYDFCNFDVTVIAVSFVHQQMVMSFKLTTLQLSFTSVLLCANFNGYF